MSITRTSPLIATLLTLGLVTDSLVAEERSETLVVVEAEPTINELELGIGHVSDDAYRFGRYNGLIDRGPYLIGNVKAKQYGESGDYWRLRATNLGLDSRYLRLESGVQGEQEYFIEYDQLPDYENDTGSTPFLNTGSTHLILPPGFSMANLNSFLQPFDQETERKRLGLGAKLFFKSRWELDSSIQHETKRGTDWIGSSMGAMEEFNIMQKTTGALLPEPIDHETDKIDVALRYHGKETQLEFAYHGSLFYNDNASLTWQDPFDLTRSGRQALEPDNQMHQLSANLGQKLSPSSRLTAVAYLAQLTQDDKFLPYSTSDTVDSLPRTSLDGEVWIMRGQVKFSSRPKRKLRLSAQYSYDERDNKTDIAEYYYFVADGISGQFVPKENDPLSFRRNQVDLTANYRLNSKMSLRGGYQYKHMHRDSQDQERETTREHTLSGKWNVRATSELDLALYVEDTKRTGSTYHTRRDENPAMRTFYLADVKRIKLGTSMNYMPTERLGLGLTAEYLDDDYTDSVLGLTEAQQLSLSLDANYRISDRITSHAFYTREAFKSHNAGAQDGKVTTPDWHAELKDTIDSVGLGANFTGLVDKWDFGADLVNTRGRGEIYMSNSITTITNPDSIAVLDPIQQFPDLKSSLTSLRLWTRYQHSDKIAYKFSYWYEDYSSEDWTLDDLEADSVGNLLLLGEDRLDYTQHVVGLSFNVQF